jgi:Predicted membrane protein
MLPVAVTFGGMYTVYNRIFWGLVLIGAGILFILDQQGLIVLDIGYIVSTYWPLILIYLGLRGLFFQFRWGKGIGFRYLSPLILITLGVYFLGRNVDYIRMSAGDFFQFVIPFLLIIIGLIIILRPGKRSDRDDAEPSPSAGMSGQPYNLHQDPDDGLHHSMKPNQDHPERKPDPVPDNQVIRPVPEVTAPPNFDAHHGTGEQDQQANVEHHFSFIGDIHIGSANWKLKPLNIQHFIGDTVVDLSRAHIPYGITKITIGSLIGDVRIMLPHDLDVEASVSLSSFAGESDVFGKREGGMLKNRQEESPGYQYAPKKLKIMINMFVGDASIDRF